MRTLTVPEAEARFRALLEDIRQGARASVTDGRLALAHIEPPGTADDARELAFLALKRHLSRAPAAGPGRNWTRRSLYRGRWSE